MIYKTPVTYTKYMLSLGESLFFFLMLRDTTFTGNSWKPCRPCFWEPS